MANLKNLFAKKIPTIIGLVLLVAGLGIAIFMVGGSTNTFFPKASPETAPQNIKVTNITDRSFTISFITDTETGAYIKYGSKSDQITARASDDREQTSGVPQNSTTHHITLRGLNPSTTYYFLIGTGTSSVYSDNGKPYEVTTGPTLGGAPEAVTAYGNVDTEAGRPATDSIVYMTTTNGAALSALVKTSGSWAIPLSTARTSDLKAYLNPEAGTPVSVLVQGAQRGKTASAQTTVKQTQPLEKLVLGSGAPPAASSTPPEASGGEMPPMPGDTAGTPGAADTPPESSGESAFSAAQLGTGTESSVTESDTGTTTIKVLTIPAAGTVLKETQPTIEGTAPANTELQIKIESDPVYNLATQADENGNWTVTPPADLATGEHTLTVSYTDENGQKQTLKRKFLVQANGATGSARGTGSTPSYTSTDESSADTPSATGAPRPTTTPKTTAKATTTPKTTAKTRVSTASATPVAGSTEQTITLLLAGFFMTTGGAFLSKKLAQETLQEAEEEALNTATDTL